MAEHYYSEKQTSEFKPVKVRFRVLGKEFELFTAGGVFSPKKLDKGSLLLIESAHVEKGWRVLDLGCGYGAVGVALLLANPGIEMVFSDVNSRAVKLTRRNLRLHKLEGLVRQGSAFEKLEGEMFDTILLNPPQTAGKKICFQMIEESFSHLNDGGSLQIVARHKKGGIELSKKMESVFGNVEDVAKKSGYRVYISVKKKE